MSARSALALCLASPLLLLPPRAAAEVAAVAVGASDEAADLAPLATAAAEALAARGVELAPPEAVEAATAGPLRAEPAPGALERWAAALGADLVVAVFRDEGGASLRLSMYRAASRTTTSSSEPVSAGGETGAVARLVERLLGPARPAVAAPPAPRPEPAEPGAAAAPAPPPPAPLERPRSRVGFVLNTTAFGLSLMAGVLCAADVEDPRLFAPILLLGGATGLATALMIERRWSISRGDSSLLAAGSWYGAAAGTLLAGALGYGSLRWIFTGGLIGQVLGLSAGIVAAAFTELSTGDTAVIHSGALWGLFAGGVLSLLVWHSDPRMSYGLILPGLAVGLAAGVLTSRFVEASAGRLAVIDLCGLLGALLGASIGIPIIIDDQDAGQMRAYTGILLGAAAAGIGLGVVLTRRWDANRERREHRARGDRRGPRLAVVPSPTVIPPSEAIPGSRASLGVQVLGGAW